MKQENTLLSSFLEHENTETQQNKSIDNKNKK